MSPKKKAEKASDPYKIMRDLLKPKPKPKKKEEKEAPQAKEA